jgi:sporulation-control protein spo0M
VNYSSVFFANGLATSFAIGSATGPAANQTLTTLSLPPGFYEVIITLYVDGTTTAADDDNITVQFARVAVPSSGAVVQYKIYCNSLTSFAVGVRSSSAGGAAAVYHASVQATEIQY